MLLGSFFANGFSISSPLLTSFFVFACGDGLIFVGPRLGEPRLAYSALKAIAFLGAKAGQWAFRTFRVRML